MVTAITLAIATLALGATDSTASCSGHAGERVSATPASDGAASSPIRIWLQIIRVAPMTDNALATLLAETRAIWSPYHVVVCPVLTLSVPETAAGEHWIKLIIRTAPANRIDGQTPRGHRAPASITFTGPTTPGNVVYASLESARESVETAQLSHLPPEIRERLAVQFLGRAIAHELGHYLLGSTRHSKKGLMRARFDDHDLVSSDHNTFRLEPQEAAALAQRGRRASDAMTSSTRAK